MGSYLRVPVGHDAERWSTFRGERTLLVAARTLTSTIRILETLPAVLRGDARVTVVAAHDATSAFSDGAADLLRDAGFRVMPWEQLESVEPDLIIAASENIDLPEGRCPLLVLPHGVGFRAGAGLAQRADPAVGDGARLRAGDGPCLAGRLPPGPGGAVARRAPGVAGRTILTGDPCDDALRAALPAAARYRRAMGVEDGRRLVVVSSTWGPTSLLGRDPEFPARLLAALPVDAYRVAAILHPNVWAGHGGWQVRTLQAAALEAG
ncbi:hypothetical protein NKH77_06205 [Streptomyces sp. M19]